MLLVLFIVLGGFAAGPFPHAARKTPSARAILIIVQTRRSAVIAFVLLPDPVRCQVFLMYEFSRTGDQCVLPCYITRGTSLSFIRCHRYSLCIALTSSTSFFYRACKRGLFCSHIRAPGKIS